MDQNIGSIREGDYDLGLRDHMMKTYSLIGYGLAVSALCAWLVLYSPLRAALITDAGGLTLLGHVGLWSPLALLVLATLRVVGRTTAGAGLVYWAFVALEGIGLAAVSRGMPPAAIVQALAVTACTFGAMSLYGYTTPRPLGAAGSFFTMGLFGLIIASVVNLFLGSAAIEFAISVIGVAVFAGLTAYDTQRVRDMYRQRMSADDLAHGRYWAALGLYLNILNLYNFFISFGRD
jgi:hypothetical protein